MISPSSDIDLFRCVYYIVIEVVSKRDALLYGEFTDISIKVGLIVESLICKADFYSTDLI